MKTLLRLTQLIALAGCCPLAFSAELPLPVEDFSLDFDNEVRLKFRDQNSGGVRYTLYQSGDLQNWSLVSQPTVEVNGDGSYDIFAALGAPLGRQFYRVTAERTTATLGFQIRELEVEEGSGEQSLVVAFVDENGEPLIYNGRVRFEWSGAVHLVSQLTGEVMANGTDVAIPLAVLDNVGTEKLTQVELRLLVDESTGYEVDPATSVTTLTIAENDNYWRGSFQTGLESLDLELFIRSDDSSLLVFMTEGTAFLPAEFVLAAAPALSETAFQAEFPAVALTATAENLIAAGADGEPKAGC